MPPYTIIIYKKNIIKENDCKLEKNNLYNCLKNNNNCFDFIKALNECQKNIDLLKKNNNSTQLDDNKN